MQPFVETPLQQLYGVGDVQGIQLGQQNFQNTVDKGTLANQYDAQNNPLLIQKQTLANQFDQQNNPLRIQHQTLQNEGLGSTNRINAVKANVEEGTQQFQLNEAQRKDALGASEQQLKMMQAQAQTWGMSEDPVLQAKGQKLMQMSQAAIQARENHKYEMEKQELIRKSAEKVAAGNNAATIQAASIRAKPKDINPDVIAAKLGYEKGAAYYTIQAANTDDKVEAQQYRDMAAKFEQANLNAKNAAAASKPDMAPVIGVPNQKVPLVLGGDAPAAPRPTAVPSDLPPGTVLHGTAGGKPVYKLPNGSLVKGN